MRWSLALAMLVLLPVTAAGQVAQVGQLGGEVRDAQGGVLPGATVTLISVERGVTRTMVTDQEGKYLFSALPLGRYNVEVTLPSFAKATLENNLVEADRLTSVPVTLQIAGVTVEATVVGETPIVDASNQTLTTRLRAEEFQNLPLAGRSYQTLMGSAPGVVGTGNVNAHGALTSNNLFLFDGVNTTDPTTGTFGANLNFEAIQEVVIRTSTAGVEFGRATGAIVDVITKSGTNRYEGSFKYIATNDQWNAQNTTKNEVTDASLERTKFDKVNNIYSGTIGGPFLKNRLWGFFAYEKSETTTPERQTAANTGRGFQNENYQQTTESPFWVLRVTSQLSRNHNVWAKYTTSPTNGFVNDYWGGSPELFSLTLQDQTNGHFAAQYTGVFGQKWTGEVMVAKASETIDVVPYKNSQLASGAPFIDLVDGRIYNGATFDGFVDRPRTQATAAMNYFTTLAGNSHQVKFGVDWQGMNSENAFRYPNNQLFYVFDFDPVARDFTLIPGESFREDYEDAPSKSTGDQVAFYARDKFQLGSRVNIEAGFRLERQTGKSDIGVGTVDSTVLAPRVSGSYSLTPDGKTIVLGSYGRFHDGILQDFSDSFANVAQQTNYDNYVWVGPEGRFTGNEPGFASNFVYESSFSASGNSFQPNADVSPRHMDEFTLGFERQLNNVMGVGVRFINRDWSNFIDDIRTFNADGTLNRTVANIDSADRTYRGIEFTFDKRYSNGWSANGSYTYSKSEGNHIADAFSALEDFAGATCRQTVDPGLPTTFPCSDIYPNLQGKLTWDRPHMVKFGGTYLRPVGPINLTFGAGGSASSKTTFTKQRNNVSVLSPVTGGQFTTMTYFYEPRGSDRVDGILFLFDFAVEGTYRLTSTTNFGLKLDVINVFNNEEKINVNNQNWCASAETAACQTLRDSFGKATARASFQTPRTIRVTALVRF
jgi:hypothetical protein